MVREQSGSSEVDSKTERGMLGVILPPDLLVWSEVRKMVADARIRMDDLASMACQDPAIAIELLKTANSMYFSEGRPPVSTVKACIERLGAGAAIETLDKMRDYEEIEDPGISKWFEVNRARCRRTARCARFISEMIAKPLSEDCEIAGGLVFVGELIAVLHFGQTFVEIAEANSRPKVLYRLEKDHKFDAVRSGVLYLRRAGLPETVLFAIDEEAQSKSPSRAVMKPICAAAGELVNAYDQDRWEKYAPSQQLSPKSAVRMLRLKEQQYETLYERLADYFREEIEKVKTEVESPDEEDWW